VIFDVIVFNALAAFVFLFRALYHKNT